MTSSAYFNELVRELSHPVTTEATFAASKVNRFKVLISSFIVLMLHVLTFVLIPIMRVVLTFVALTFVVLTFVVLTFVVLTFVDVNPPVLSHLTARFLLILCE